MRRINILILTFVVAIVSLTGCYKDKGSYDYNDWLGIASITPLTFPGGSNLFEGDKLVIEPVVVYKDGFSAADYQFEWFYGDHSIGKGLKLDWTIAILDDAVTGTIPIYLSIKSKRTQEDWKVYPAKSLQVIKPSIYGEDTPLLGAIITQNANEIEWASIKATKGDFASKTFDGFQIKTNLYSKYNGASLQGSFVAATYSTKDLAIFTPTGGGSVRVRELQTEDEYIPFGKSVDVYRNIFSAQIDPTKPIKSIYRFNNVTQSALVGGEFYAMPATSSFPYISVDPVSGVGFQRGVAQLIYPEVPSKYGFYGLLRYDNGEIKMIKASASDAGVIAVGAKLEEGTTPLNLDEIISVFSEGAIENTYTTMSLVVVGRKGTSIKLVRYTVNSSATNCATTYKETIDVTAWAGGITEKSIWFSTLQGTSDIIFNPAFIANGNTLYRFNYGALTVAPVAVATFSGEITEAIACQNNMVLSDSENARDNEIYTAVFTYDSGANKSSIYFLDTYTGAILKGFDNSLNGKVVKYLPVIE